MQLTTKNLKRWLYWIIFLPVNFYRWAILQPLVAKKIRLKIAWVNNQDSGSAALSGQFFLASSFRISSQERQEILKTTFSQTLKNFSGNTVLKIADASDEPFAASNKQILESINGLKLEYENKKERLNWAYYNLLSAAKEKYFCMLFDDFPITNLSEDFLAASTCLLNDFKSLVDIIFIEGINTYKIDEANRKIYYDLDSRDFKQHQADLLGIVKYGEYEFAILKNFHYGFFFNTIIADSKDYARRLKWFMGHIDYNSPHAIELAGSLKIGPGYHFIAVPLRVFNFDIDYSHTDISIRQAVEGAKELQKALDSGFSLEEQVFA